MKIQQQFSDKFGPHNNIGFDAKINKSERAVNLHFQIFHLSDWLIRIFQLRFRISEILDCV